MVAFAEPLIDRIRHMISRLRDQEDVTVFVRHLPDELHFRGQFLGSTEDLNGIEWLDLEIPGQSVIGLPLHDIYDIERHNTLATA